MLASRLLVDLAGAEPTGSVDVNDGLPERPVVTLRPERSRAVIGLDVPDAEQRSILERLDFDVDEGWHVTVPTFRARDVTREIDVVEEVARVVLDRVPQHDAAPPRGRGPPLGRAAVPPRARGRTRRRRVLRGVHLEPRARPIPIRRRCGFPTR